MEVDLSSKKKFKIAKQSIKDRKDVMGNVCVRNRFDKLCINEGEELRRGKSIWKK